MTLLRDPKDYCQVMWKSERQRPFIHWERNRSRNVTALSPGEDKSAIYYLLHLLDQDEVSVVE